MRQKQRLHHKPQRCRKHPRSRQGWVLLHPMFPMKLSEYRDTLMAVSIKFEPKTHKSVARFKSLQAQIRRPSEQQSKLSMERITSILCTKIVRRFREESWKTKT